MNHEQTETGLSAVGVALPDHVGLPAGISLALPTARFDKAEIDRLVRELRECATQIGVRFAADHRED